MEKHPIRFWDRHKGWEEAEKTWDENSDSLKASHELRTFKELPKNEPGIRKKTKKNLRWKALKYLLVNDEKKVFPKYFLKKPLTYSVSMIASYLKKNPYQRDDDFFLYGVESITEFKQLLREKNSILVIGFSYCHKPFECPSGRFNDECIHNDKSPICGQCFIGKCMHAMPEKQTVPVVIPTVHDIGEKMFELSDENPGKKILFIITACELTLQMFADWGNMIKIRGVGVRLGGQICNTMHAFEASERGIKPGMTVVLDKTQTRMMELISIRRSAENKTS
jgi:hypothetical protein